MYSTGTGPGGKIMMVCGACAGLGIAGQTHSSDRRAENATSLPGARPRNPEKRWIHGPVIMRLCRLGLILPEDKGRYEQSTAEERAYPDPHWDRPIRI